MKIDLVMPQLGESVAEGTVTRWIKKVGDSLVRDEPVLEITTDKVDSEIPSPGAGWLVDLRVKEGETVKVGTVLGVIDTESATAAPAGAAAPAAPKAAPAKAAAPAAAAASAPARQLGVSVVRQPTPAPAAAATATAPAGEKTGFYSPLVLSIARAEGVSMEELARIEGTGAGGRVSKKDILGWVEQRNSKGSAATATAPAEAPRAPATPSRPAPAAPPAAPRPAAAAAAGRVEVKPMDHMRKAIAEHMVRSGHPTPHVTSVTEADVTKIVSYREAHKDAFEKREGFRLTFTPFFVQAAVEALKAFPVVNASVDGESIVYHHYCNIGLAVALENGGLIVPVVKNAEERNFLGLARAADDLARRARDKKLSPDDVKEGTFTITNPGVFGGLFGTPIINQPQAGILGIGAIKKRPVVIDDAIAIRSMIYLTLSYDHRIIDGAVGVRFLQKIVEWLETFEPSRAFG
jgi:2-oxoglutarate dehydrogenase E2 component (dihydrolipoamide succinyltransferase)